MDNLVFFLIFGPLMVALWVAVGGLIWFLIQILRGKR